MKKTLLPVLSCLLMLSCSKGSDNNNTAPTTESFAIDGIHELTMGSTPSSNVLPITVSRTPTSTQESVALSVTSLPAYATATISPTSGIPAYAAAITFGYDYSGPGGTFPIKVIGTAASGSRSYDMNLVIPSNNNGWALDGRIFNKGTVGRDSSGGVPALTAISSESPGLRMNVVFHYGSHFPTTTTTYNVNKASNDNEVMIFVYDTYPANYTSNYGRTTTDDSVTIEVNNGKFTVKTKKSIDVKDGGTGTIKKLAINFGE